MRCGVVRGGGSGVAAVSFAVALFCVAFGASTASAEPLWYATLEPKEIPLGSVARLTMTNIGTVSKPPSLPVVEGLSFEVIGHTRQFEFSNRNSVPASSIIIEVTPQLAGTYYIPPITPTAQPLILHVTVAHAGAAASEPGNTNYLIRPPVQAIAPKKGSPLTDGPAFVRLNLPSRDVFVGESVPVDIVVGVRSGIVTALNGLPTLHGGAFTLNNLSHQPDREERIVDATHITLLTWHSLLAAVKPGMFSLDVETPLTVKISKRSRQDSALDELLGDPFLQNYFGASVSKQITVASPSARLNVLPIPAQGRPADFSGAVGTFKIASELSPARGAAGDPLTLRLRVSGAGNFDRVNSAMFEHLNDWKTYPPKSSFHAGDGIGYRGEKIFEQPLVASRAGTHSIPPLAFSYFDPATRRFETARSAVLTIEIAPTLADQAPSPAVRLLALRPDRADQGPQTTSLTPLYLRPTFFAVPSLTTLMFAGTWLVSRRRQATLATIRISRSARRHLADLAAAAVARDVPSYFATARAMLLEALAQRWQLSVAQLTDDVLRSRLGTESEDIREFFLISDQARYGRSTSAAVDFSRWTQLIRREIGMKERR